MIVLSSSIVDEVTEINDHAGVTKTIVCARVNSMLQNQTIARVIIIILNNQPFPVALSAAVSEPAHPF